MLTKTHETWIAEWAKAWRLPDLTNTIKLEFSPRIRRSLGRCHTSKGLIRLHPALLKDCEDLLREVLCHEVAHIAVHLIHGSKVRPHGREWAELMKIAGFTPRVRMRLEALPAPIRAAAAPRVLYEHSCPICGMSRTAGRPVRRWRCRTCREAGLEGQLQIVTRPVLEAGGR